MWRHPLRTPHRAPAISAAELSSMPRLCRVHATARGNIACDGLEEHMVEALPGRDQPLARRWSAPAAGPP
eukprot:7197566-Alexandrium_andersonii.AAC.1